MSNRVKLKGFLQTNSNRITIKIDTNKIRINLVRAINSNNNNIIIKYRCTNRSNSINSNIRINKIRLINKNNSISNNNNSNFKYRSLINNSKI